MRRRDLDDDLEQLPPPHLLTFDPGYYAPELDAREAYEAWHAARLRWQAAHGWPGDLDALDLIRDARTQRRARRGWPATY